MKNIAIASLVVVALLAAAATAAPSASRPFVPVQDGFVAAAPEVPLWAPDHLLVQLTPTAAAASALNSPDKAGGPARTTGLAAVDAVLATVAVKAIDRAFVDPTDKAASAGPVLDRWYRVDLDGAPDIEALAGQLKAQADVEDALPDYYVFPAAVPNDPQFPDNWGHNNTAQLPAYGWGTTWDHTGAGVGTVGFDANAIQAWDGAQGYGSGTVIVAIVDSGVDTAHPDLNLVAGYDFGDGDSNPMDDSAAPGHGTSCAGVAAAVANNALGVAGAAGACAIMPLKIADSTGSLTLGAATSAITWAVSHGADVISMSFGATLSSYSPMDTAMQNAFNAGVVLLAATGNENASTISYPANSASVIAVGAASPCGDRKRSSSLSTELNPGVTADPNGYTCDGERWWGSNYGLSLQNDRRAVDVIAPTILPTTDISGSGGYTPGDYEPFFNGTSCATPYAAGVCALIKSANPGWTATQVRDQLRNTAQDIVNVESAAGWDRYSGYGMVDAAAAVGATGPLAPIAAFTASPTSACAGEPVTFTDQSTGDVTTWAWSFGDGGTSTDVNPSYAYAAAGSYTVTLIVTGPAGADTLSQAAYITVGEGPTGGFTPSTTIGPRPLLVQFTDTSVGATSWLWNFGDGGTDVSQNPVHTYIAYGTFTVTQIATNACGSDTTVAVDLITVLPPAPTAAFTGSPTSGCAPLGVDFTDQSTGSPTSWAWTFGDGGTSTLQNPSHAYAAPGSYDVTLIVANAGGADTLSVAGYITANGGPTAAFSASDSTGTAPFEVTFTDLSTDADSWAWDFGDGGTSTLQNPVHSYAAAGLYTVRLIAGNACAADTLTAVDLIAVDAVPVPTAAFAVSPDAGCAPLDVIFTDQSTGAVDAWAWSFGDGDTSSVQNPVHAYVAPGSYDVRLIVSGAGGVDTLTVAGAVTVGTPVAAGFAFSDTVGAPPLPITFTDQSTGGPTAWHWDFGDGSVDTVQNPVHSYTVDGTYTVTLIVTNGCSADTLAAVDAILISHLSAVGDRVPGGFGLAQNYPNPFNPSTTITFAMTKDGPARLEIYDAAGRRVAVLVDGLQAAGEHSVLWQPRTLASGVYFARFAAEGQSQVRRLTLLK